MAINIPNLKLRRTYFTINAPATGIIKDKCVRGAKNKKTYKSGKTRRAA